MQKTIKILILIVIEIIDFIKRILYPQGVCRFYPSCSEYARNAVAILSPQRAIVEIIKRIVKCNPISTFGIDPVLPQYSKNKDGNKIKKTILIQIPINKPTNTHT